MINNNKVSFVCFRLANGSAKIGICVAAFASSQRRDVFCQGKECSLLKVKRFSSIFITKEIAYSLNELCGI